MYRDNAGKTDINAANLRRNSRYRLRWFDFTARGMLRLAIVALVAWILFGYVVRPVFINGGSMLPTYPESGINFCWMPKFWFGKPYRGQVVVARYAGEKVLLLKRVVALEGEEVEFRDGKLWVNGKEQMEPYVKFKCDWNLPPRRVDSGYVYVVGDNRNMPLEKHKFGQIDARRIIGIPLW